MRIAELKEIDIDQYHKLRCELYPEPQYTKDEIYDEITHMLEGKRFADEEKQYCYGLIEEPDEVVGLIEFFIYPERRCDDSMEFMVEERHVFIESLIIKEGYRERGWGRKLVEYAWSMADLPVYVDTEGEAARRFYEKTGFKLIRENTGKYEYILKLDEKAPII